MKIVISEIHFKDKKIEEYATKKAAKLQKFHPNIVKITIRLTSEKSHRNQHHTAFCELEFDLPGKNFVVRDSERKIDKAIDKAYEKAKRTLVKHKEKLITNKHKRGIVHKVIRNIHARIRP